MPPTDPTTTPPVGNHPLTRKDLQTRVRAAKAARKDSFHAKNAALAAFKKGKEAYKRASLELAEAETALARFDSGAR